jgi:DNA helicase-2/ATP-dependent DNA helicase PcrA
MRLLNTPNTQQAAILASQDQHNLIYGNAGSAKTTTLALKVMAALKGGMSPSAIQVLTYSQAAVQAFRERLSWMGTSKEVIKQVRVQTFNELCQEQLAELEGKTQYLDKPNREVYSTVLQAIDSARQHAEARGHLDDFAIHGDGSLLVPSLLHTFRRIKGTMSVRVLGNEFVLTPASADEAKAEYTDLAVLRAYERLRAGESSEGRAENRSENRSDNTSEGDFEREEYRDSLGPKFRLEDDPFYDMACVLTADDPVYTAEDHPLKLGISLLLVDEGHDMNRAMFTVLQHLIEHNPISQDFVVGDIDQVVHSDGGADQAFMQEAFIHTIGQASEYHLETGWRFGDSLARPLALHAHKPYATDPDKDTRIEILRVADVKLVAALIDGAFQSALEESGGKAPSLAVVLRHPGSAVQLENALALRGYSTQPYGFEPFALRPEILFLRVLVAWATNNIGTLAQADLSHIQRAMAEFTGCMNDKRFKNVSYKNLGTFHTHFLGDLERFIARADKGDSAPIINFSDGDAAAILRPFLAQMRGAEPSELARLVQGSGFVSMAKRAFVFDEQVDEAMASMIDFARSAAELETFSAWLAQMTNRDADVRRGRAKGGQILRLYSIPAAKGLEFDHVVIPDVSAGSFDGLQQEERNLFYVATSRARKKLTMTFTSRPSSFLSSFGRAEDWSALS